MTRIVEKRAGRRLLPAAAAFCLLFSGLGIGVHAEESIVVDGGSAEEAPVQEENAASTADPAQIDGLFEIVSEQQGYAGEAAGETEDTKGKKKKEKQLIVGYKQTGVQASIRFEMGEKPSLASLQRQFPSTLDVYFLGEKKAKTLSVTWECYGDDYSSTNLNYYFFTPKFDESKYEVKGLNLQSESPYIEVIQNAFTYEMIESAPPKENEAAVVAYCREKLKLNTAATCGILANIYCESGFRTNAIGDGGTSVGICQWHNSRWTNLRAFASDDWQTLEGQLRFMRKELRSGYRKTLKYLQNVSDDEQGAYDAAYYWCMHYEMPDKILSRSTTRGYLAKNVYWKRYGLGEEETESELLTGETESEAPADETESEALADETESEALLQETGPERPVQETGSDTISQETAQPESGQDAKAQAEASEREESTETESEEKPVGKYRCISDDGLFIRSAQTTDSEAVGSIPFDETVDVLDIQGEWARVRYEDKEGYSKLEYLEKLPDGRKKDEGSLETRNQRAG